MNGRLAISMLSVVVLVVLVAGLPAGGKATAQTSPGATTRVSINSTGTQANGDSSSSSISADGRFVAFESRAGNLVSTDANAVPDVFVHDRQNRSTTRVSISSAGAEGNDWSYDSAISADGRFVVFRSMATNLISNDANDAADIFIHDRQNATTILVSVSSSGAQANSGSLYPAISADGRFVVFLSDASNLFPEDASGWIDVFIRDLQEATTAVVSVSSSGSAANGDSWNPAVSADGRFVVFESEADNLISGDTNNAADIFVHDRQNGTTTRVSINSAGEQGNDNSTVPAVSADGRYVAFESRASNLIADDTNQTSDVFVHDTQNGTTTRVSVDSTGAQGNNGSYKPTFTADGRFVVFESGASNLVPGDTNDRYDVFIHDRQSGTTARISISSTGAQGNNSAFNAAVSSDGRYVAFDSEATNLVSGDSNAAGDVFVRDRGTDSEPTVYYLSPTGSGAVAGKSFTGADILSYVKDADTWDVVYDGSYVKTTKNVNAFTFDGDDILLSFAANQTIAGLGTFAPQDIVRFTPATLGYNATVGTFAWHFDGSDVGLSGSAENIDALHLLPDGRLLLSTTGTAKVPGPGGTTITAQDEDVLAFTPITTGAATTGTWALYFDGTPIPSLKGEDVNGFWEDPATGERYVTIVGAFTIGSAPNRVSGNGKSIVKLTPNTAAPGGWAPSLVTWLAPGAAFPSNLDGLGMTLP